MKKTNLVFGIIAWIIVIICFCLYWPRVQATVEEKKEQIRLDGILEEINNLYIANEEITQQWNELEEQQQQLHGSAEENRAKINELWNSYYKDNDTWNVMGVICEKAPKSPMCNNYWMLESLKKIASERWVDYKLLLGIMYAESHIGSNFNAEQCRASNNRAWLKARKYDDWKTSEWFDKQKWKIDGCWLYNFEKVEDFFESLANTISLWYGKCNEDVYCIMRSYVWHESGAWVRNVYMFKSL
jgi:hypothetical protein